MTPAALTAAQLAERGGRILLVLMEWGMVVVALPGTMVFAFFVAGGVWAVYFADPWICVAAGAAATVLYGGCVFSLGVTLGRRIGRGDA